MIDMSHLYLHSDYPNALNDFQNSRKWNIFTSVHMKVAKNRCPICECALLPPIQRQSNNGTTQLSPTIDHYRPKDASLYSRLEFDDKNYLLMCSDCNNAYKGNKFPLYQNGLRDTNANCTTDISGEMPLIVNPIFDDIINLFQLVFRITTSGRKVIELQPLATAGYDKEKALITIKLFCLGNCDDPTHIHSNLNVHNCRINLLNNHFNRFIPFIKALSEKKMKKAFAIKKARNLEQYGFYNFIMKNQFIDLTP